MKILLIEDDPIIAKSISQFLKHHNYIIDVAPDGEVGFNLADTGSYDLILTDFMLPKINGADIISNLRNNGNKTPIIALSICDKTENKINLLTTGADDYLTKPFFFTELQARIKALLRRREIILQKIIKYEDLELDLLSHEAKRAGQTIYLTTKEFSLLNLLIKNPTHVFSRQTINELAWDEASHCISNITEAYILKLRNKIDFKKPFLIKTVSGRGYKIDVND